jgi:cold shock CspA family protein
MLGRVKKFSPDKRFGQIRPDGEKIDLFFHRDDVIAGAELCFTRGAPVAFIVVPDPKHPGSRRAAQVQLIEEIPDVRKAQKTEQEEQRHEAQFDEEQEQAVDQRIEQARKKFHHLLSPRSVEYAEIVVTKEFVGV